MAASLMLRVLWSTFASRDGELSRLRVASLMRMLPQELLRLIKAVSILGGFPYFFYVLGVDGAAFVAPVVADEGEE